MAHAVCLSSARREGGLRRHKSGSALHKKYPHVYATMYVCIYMIYTYASACEEPSRLTGHVGRNVASPHNRGQTHIVAKYVKKPLVLGTAALCFFGP